MILNCVAYENGRKLADIDVDAISDGKLIGRPSGHPKGGATDAD